MSNLDVKQAITHAVTTAATAAASDPNTTVQTQDIPAIVSAGSAVAHSSPAVRELQSRIDYVMNNEAGVKSWGNWGGGVATITGIYGLFEAFADGWQPAEDKTLIIVGVGSLVTAALFIAGRFRGKPIGE